jgi:hypothetical protein
MTSTSGWEGSWNWRSTWICSGPKRRLNATCWAGVMCWSRNTSTWWSRWARCRRAKSSVQRRDRSRPSTSAPSGASKGWMAKCWRRAPGADVGQQHLRQHPSVHALRQGLAAHDLGVDAAQVGGRHRLDRGLVALVQATRIGIGIRPVVEAQRDVGDAVAAPCHPGQRAVVARRVVAAGVEEGIAQPMPVGLAHARRQHRFVPGSVLDPGRERGRLRQAEVAPGVIAERVAGLAPARQRVFAVAVRDALGVDETVGLGHAVPFQGIEVGLGDAGARETAR